MKILVASPIAPEALHRLRERNDVVTAFNADGTPLPELLADREALVFRSGVSISSDLLDGALELRLVIRAGSGLDNIDLASVRERGIRLLRVPGPSADAVGEFTFGLMLAVARRVALADRLLRDGHWPKHELGGPLLREKTLGIVGVGNIGSRVAELGVVWGMRVIGCVADPTPERAEAFRLRGVGLIGFGEVVARADFLTLHVPLNDSTRRLIDGPALERMKPGAVMVNASRGGVVDEGALHQALAAGSLAGAALDVHEREGEGTMSPFRDLPNVVLTPHIGGMALDSQRQIGDRVIGLVEAFEAGRIDAAATEGEMVV